MDNFTANNQQLRTLNAIKICRTAKLGGHKKKCNNCGNVEISYNSCRNRHCPKCQAVARERWIMQRQAELLDVAYFHIVFTLPHQFNALAKQNPKQVYNALFRASWQTIKQFAGDPDHLGAKTGMTAILHTWGQQMSLHPHVHCIVPGGGIDKKGSWIVPKKYRKKSKQKIKYLFPKKALSIVYRAKFMACLREQLTIPQDVAKQVMQTNWVVYAKQPFLGPKQVIEYLGRYTHKIAISNHRLLSVENGKITFNYKDYSNAAINKQMSLNANEFIRRFCLHILPHGFIRIRHYGILASRNKAIDLNKAKEYFGLEKWVKQKIDWLIIAQEKFNINPKYCSICKSKTMIITQVINPERGPPLSKLQPNYDF